MNYPQNPYPSQQPPYTSYPQQAPGAAAYPPQYPYPQQAPGAIPYPPQPYAQQPQGAMAYPYMAPQVNMVLSNPRAKRAMWYGIFSLALGALTLATLIGSAGLITGTFAIIYGVIGLNTAKKTPNNLGHGQALAGLLMGCAAWALVILSFILRSASRGY